MKTSNSVSRCFRNCLIVAGLITSAIGLAQGVDSSSRQYKRIKPNTRADNTSGIFFKDVFEQALRGERPATTSGSGGPPTQPIGPPAGEGKPTATPIGSGKDVWSKVVSSQTIEDEIKRIKLAVDRDVTTPSAFNGLGHKKCRENFSLLGMLFAIAGEYDGVVRWKKDAPTARDLFARAGRNCKVATPASYKESKLRKQDLADMVAGSRLEGTGDAAVQADWSQVSDRSELMKRLEKSVSRLKELTANAGEFKSNADDAKHEAEMLAAISATMQKDGMADAEDDDYAVFCETMQNAAGEIVDATRNASVDAASKAMGEINRACADCHDIYRG